jgi:hypothetical protein
MLVALKRRTPRSSSSAVDNLLRRILGYGGEWAKALGHEAYLRHKHKKGQAANRLALSFLSYVLLSEGNRAP